MAYEICEHGSIKYKCEICEFRDSLNAIKIARDKLSIYSEGCIEDATGPIVKVDKKSLWHLLNTIDAQ